MFGSRPLEELTEGELLEVADECAQTARHAEVDLLRVAYQWALVNGADRLDPAGADLPGRERVKRLGGDGVPLVCEFAAAELGGRIGRSPAAAGLLMADALDLRHRLPVLWARVEAHEVVVSYARHVARATRELTLEEAGLVDAGVVTSADGRIGWSRFEALVAGQVVAAAPAAARAKEERAAQARFAKRLRQTDPDALHGMASFLVRADVATITEIDAVVTAVATALKLARPELGADELRVQAVMVLLHLKVDPTLDLDAEENPDLTADLADIDLKSLLPVVQLFVHMYANTLGIDGGIDGGTDEDPRPGPVARVEGHGPVTTAWVREVLGPHCRFQVRPVIDVAGQAPVDAYEIPDRHRTAVHLMSPADVFPFAANLGRGKQIDHTIPYDHTDPGGPPGQSRIGNYGPMTGFHHRIKTHSAWQVQQPWAGIYLWRDPHGVHYLVDHTGTRRLHPTPDNETHSPAEIDLCMSAVELSLHAV